MVTREHISELVYVASSNSYRTIECDVEYRREGQAGSAHYDDRPLYRYGVFVKGKRLGDVAAAQTESRNRRSRHLLVSGYPVRWLASTASHRLHFRTRREAAIQVLEDKLPRRRQTGS